MHRRAYPWDFNGISPGALRARDRCLRKPEMVTRTKIALPTAFPYQAGFTDFAGRIAKLPP